VPVEMARALQHAIAQIASLYEAPGKAAIAHAADAVDQALAFSPTMSARISPAQGR